MTMIAIKTHCIIELGLTQTPDMIFSVLQVCCVKYMRLIYARYMQMTFYNSYNVQPGKHTGGGNKAQVTAHFSLSSRQSSVFDWSRGKWILCYTHLQSNHTAATDPLQGFQFSFTPPLTRQLENLHSNLPFNFNYMKHFH